MRLCIPTLDTKGLDSEMCDHFGSAPYFTLYDTESSQVTTAVNGHRNHIHGSCMPVDMLKTHQADTVLCKGMGARAIDLLVTAGIKPYLVDAETVSEAIAQFKAKNVRILNVKNACQHHDCHP